MLCLFNINFTSFRNYAFFTILSFLIVSIDANLLLAESHKSKSFFPLSISNIWITRDVSSQPNPTLFKHQVIDTIRISNELYYEVDLYGSHYYREDSSGHFYQLKDSIEQIIIDFNIRSATAFPLVISMAVPADILFA